MDEDSQIGRFDLNKLRDLFWQYVDNQLYVSALFWADKICSLSQFEVNDTLCLAHALILTKQFARAVHLLRARGLIQANATARYMAAKCYYESKEFRSALEVLEGGFREPKLGRLSLGLDEEPCKFSPSVASNSSRLSGGRKIESATALLKGMVCEALESKDLAVQSYKEAIMLDVYCYEALELLLSHHALTSDQELQLIKSLPISDQCTSDEAQLVRFAYELKIKKYAKPTDCKIPLFLKPLAENLDLAVCVAERHFNNCDYAEAYRRTSDVLKKDPVHEGALPLFVSCLAVRNEQNTLYKWANKLVITYPNKAVSWFAVGSYYLLINKNENARKYFSKSTSIDRNFGPAWLGFAHSFAVEGEHDQAISAYYSASKLMPGSHLPFLYLGLEYSLSNNMKLAFKFYREALAISPDDPSIKHELGSLLYANGEYEHSKIMLLSALKRLETVAPSNIVGTWEPLYNNLGHVCRKLKSYAESIAYHQKALALNPKNGATYAAIGLCWMYESQFDKAVDMFHRSLSLRRDDTITVQLLSRAMECAADADVWVGSDGPSKEQELDLTSQNESSLQSSSDLDFAAMSASRSSLPDVSIKSVDNASSMSIDMSMCTPSTSY